MNCIYDAVCVDFSAQRLSALLMWSVASASAHQEMWKSVCFTRPRIRRFIYLNTHTPFVHAGNFFHPARTVNRTLHFPNPKCTHKYYSCAYNNNVYNVCARHKTQLDLCRSSAPCGFGVWKSDFLVLSPCRHGSLYNQITLWDHCNWQI